MRFLFDFDRAEDEISHMRFRLRKAEDTWESGVGASDVNPALAQEFVDMMVKQLTLDDAAAGEGVQPESEVEPASPAQPTSPRETLDEVIAMSRYADRTPAATRSSIRRVTTPSDSPLRREEAKRASAQRAVPAPVAGITLPSRCQYASMLCRGCDQELGLGTWMIPGGAAMVQITTCTVVTWRHLNGASARRQNAFAQSVYRLHEGRSRSNHCLRVR